MLHQFGCLGLIPFKLGFPQRLQVLGVSTGGTGCCRPAHSAEQDQSPAAAPSLAGGVPVWRPALGGRKRLSCNLKKENQAVHAVTSKRSKTSPATPAGPDVVCVRLQRAAGVRPCWDRGPFFTSDIVYIRLQQFRSQQAFQSK